MRWPIQQALLHEILAGPPDALNEGDIARGLQPLLLILREGEHGHEQLDEIVDPQLHALLVRFEDGTHELRDRGECHQA